MIKKTIDGKDYYIFGDNQEQAKKEFEKSVLTEEIADKMMVAFFNAMSEMEVKKKEAWSSVRKLLKSNHPELSDTFEMRYDWILGGFTIIKDNSSDD